MNAVVKRNGRPKGIPCKFKGMKLADYRAQQGMEPRGEPVRQRTKLAPAIPAPEPKREREPRPSQRTMPADVIRATPFSAEERIKERVLLPMLEEMAERCARAGFKW